MDKVRVFLDNETLIACCERLVGEKTPERCSIRKIDHTQDGIVVTLYIDETSSFSDAIAKMEADAKAEQQKKIEQGAAKAYKPKEVVAPKPPQRTTTMEPTQATTPKPANAKPEPSSPKTA